MQATIVSYAPALTYLTVVTALLLSRRGARKPVPFWIHPGLVGAGLCVRAVTDGFTPGVLIPAGLAGALFVAFLLLERVGSMLTPTGMLTVVGGVALVPLNGVLWVFGALLLASLVALWKVARVAGMGRVNVVASETMMAAGVNPSVSLRKPSAKSLITAEDSEKYLAQITKAGTQARMYLPPYLLGGAAIACLVALI